MKKRTGLFVILGLAISSIYLGLSINSVPQYWRRAGLIILFFVTMLLQSCMPGMYSPYGNSYGYQQPYGNPYATGRPYCPPPVRGNPSAYGDAAYWYNYQRLARNGGLNIGLQPQRRFRTVMEAVDALGYSR